MLLPKVTIVIPFYNCAYVDQAIVSALMQTYPNVEVIVIDDGSTRYANLIGPFTDQLYYIGKANGGTASALNYGFQLASGEYVAWLSSDDKFYPHKIERQVQFMKDHASLISFSAYDEINKYNQLTKLNMETLFNSQQDLYTMLAKGDPINGCTVMIHKNLFNRIGWFNETLRYTHDYEMWVRVLLQGVRIDYIPEPLIQYRRHDKMGTVKHLPEIKNEVKFIQNRYSNLLIEMARSMPG
jgi:teichuronic acid biosynthesis glycosyltransferase TuaG